MVEEPQHSPGVLQKEAATPRDHGAVLEPAFLCDPHVPVLLAL
tara:strand:- start:66 stop:194 length:129 start_codon:yes stop_codon:yes gene_type:complete